MKKLILLLIVVLCVWIGVNYVRTGQVALFPTVVNGAEQEVRDLEKEIAGVNEQINQAGRSAGMTGLDTTADVSALMTRKEQLEKRLAEARKKLLH
ncbi:MAG TPA: hypothetical protein VFT43_13910 [Candidatus Polarisedimenticolia bacterium]|nr:hypothetical protein [Candidatus Polarisedimenticolia bacterium]